MSDIIQFGDNEVGFGIQPADDRDSFNINPKFHPEIISGQANLFTTLTSSYGWSCTYAHQYRVGNLVTLYFRMTCTTAKSNPASANVMTGTYKGALPLYGVSCCSYWSNRAFSLAIQPNGTFIIRYVYNSAYTHSVGDYVLFSLTYMTGDY